MVFTKNLALTVCGCSFLTVSKGGLHVYIFDNSGGSPILVLGVKMLRPMNETPGANADAGMAAPRLCLEKVENP